MLKLLCFCRLDNMTALRHLLMDFCDNLTNGHLGLVIVVAAVVCVVVKTFLGHLFGDDECAWIRITIAGTTLVRNSSLS